MKCYSYKMEFKFLHFFHNCRFSCLLENQIIYNTAKQLRNACLNDGSPSADAKMSSNRWCGCS